MGIQLNDMRFLVNARKEKVSFERTLMLGRLSWYVRPSVLTKWAERTGHDMSALTPEAFRSSYSEAFFHWLGAEKVDSMDVSDYEGATVLHDLNNPVPEHLKGAYSVVFDGGTLEHIFNFPQAVRNCMEMVEVGGHFLACCPTNNEMGHGFYQFSPELWFRVLGPENGFKVERMLVYAQHQKYDGDQFYEVADPRDMQERVVMVNTAPTFLLIQARRIEAVPLFRTTPQQSDYSTTWASSVAEQEASSPTASLPVRLYRSLVPKRWRDAVYLWRGRVRPKIDAGELGRLDARHFRRFHLD